MKQHRRMIDASITAAIYMCFAGIFTAPALADEKPQQTPQAQEQAPQTVEFKVAEQEIDDLKAVFATVRSKDRIEARVRTGGTIASLKVDEGAEVTPGQVLAVIADPKIALKINALDAQVIGAKSRLKTAKLDYDRAYRLRKQGVITQASLDQLKTAFDVATNNLKAAEADRAVAERQVEEGQVLAPARGRVLQVPVTEGSVVLMGESVATIAANGYLLRLELPERHARFMKKGTKIKVGARGLSPDSGVIGEGHIIQVYPEVQHGRVIADADVPGLGTYFVGERTLVWIPAGRRKTIVVPRSYIFQRFGLDYVKVASDKGEPLDVVVQLGNHATLEDKTPAMEVLTGLKSGDRLVQP